MKKNKNERSEMVQFYDLTIRETEVVLFAIEKNLTFDVRWDHNFSDILLQRLRNKRIIVSVHELCDHRSLWLSKQAIQEVLVGVKAHINRNRSNMGFRVKDESEGRWFTDKEIEEAYLYMGHNGDLIQADSRGLPKDLIIAPK